MGRVCDDGESVNIDVNISPGSLRDAFLLEDGVAYLNHGSYGATPRTVLAAADAWRRRMEAQPVRFMQSELPKLLRATASRLAAFMGARGEDLVFVDNATAGVNAVLRSLDFGPGDELLTTTHVYGAVRRTLQYVAARAGAAIVEADVPFPASGEDEIVAAISERFSPRTRLLVIDHIASPTAIVFPVRRIVQAAKALGIAVLVDGAHAPGQLDLDVPAVGADFYVGNCHKWLFAPKSCGFLWAAPDAQARIHPLVISHGYRSGFLAEFDWTGTRDPGAWLAVNTALDFVDTIGADVLRDRNHALMREAATLIIRQWATQAGAPLSLFGAMATIAVPTDRGRFKAAPATLEAAAAVHDYLWQDRRIEIPVPVFAGRLWVRISAQIYNRIDDYQRLADALSA
jgi:isopenicillin-N epimerase